MPNPTNPVIDYSYTGFEQEQQSTPFPGHQLDNDLADLVNAAAETNAAIEDIRRSDGALKNGIVTADSLASGLLLGLSSPTVWETGVDYTAASTVWFGHDLYRCLVAHTSGVFATDLAAGKWTSAFGAIGVVLNSDTSTVAMDFVVDEDDMVSDSATKIPTQQSVKAYVDTTAQPVNANLTTLAEVVPGATGLQLLAAATQAAAWAIVSNASAFAQAGTGSFTIDQDPLPRIHKMADRLFLDGAAPFNGQFDALSMTGISADALALHSWGFRDASLLVDSSVASMSVVGHAESNKFAGWSGTTIPATPASIGVSGFAINNRVGGLGQAWGGYFDAVRLTDGFTVGIEVTMANFGTESTITPFNVKTGGADGGVSVWTGIGGGLDSVGYPGSVKDIAAGYALLSSYADNSAKARTGFVIADGALWDRSGGSFTYEAMSMPDRHQIAWYRSSDQTASAFIWADTIVGSPVGITMKTGGVEFTGGGTLVNNVFVGLAATGVTPYISAVGADANIGLSLYTKGTGVHSFFTNGTVKQFEIAHAATAVNYLSVAGGAAGGGVTMSALGSDTNIPLTIQSKGSGAQFFNIRSLTALQLDGVAAAVNRLAIINAATTGQPILYVAGTDTNISGSLRGLGTGGWQFLDGASAKKFEYNTTGIGFFATAPVAAKTGWGVPTGTFTRTTFVTSTVTLPELAERVAALIQDFHQTAGYGLLRT